MKTALRIAACGALAALASVAWAHSGGLNAEGCHNDRKNGGYHCHRSPAAAPPNATQFAPVGASGYNAGSGRAFRNCTAARAAGGAPVRRGEPGYGSHLDRDNDGVGCE
ncbi:excalibur calcium-binding domain-containing protein [Lysobacter sp. F60174L2]|uniref:excalibur calcium-binding domain-containing protein n=1 Tax=Lysobacter sp. F60174L2 TaxID=3459295 RepID=UPI00403DB47C